MEWMDQRSEALGNDHIDAIICEDWRTRPAEESRHANTWSEQIPARIIGILMHEAWLRNIEFVLQQAAIKPVGYGMAGLTYKKGAKGKHMHDAVAHGVYWYMNKYLKRQGRVAQG